MQIITVSTHICTFSTRKLLFGGDGGNIISEIYFQLLGPTQAEAEAEADKKQSKLRVIEFPHPDAWAYWLDGLTLDHDFVWAKGNRAFGIESYLMAFSKSPSNSAVE